MLTDRKAIAGSILESLTIDKFLAQAYGDYLNKRAQAYANVLSTSMSVIDDMPEDDDVDTAVENGSSVYKLTKTRTSNVEEEFQQELAQARSALEARKAWINSKLDELQLQADDTIPITDGYIKAQDLLMAAYNDAYTSVENYSDEVIQELEGLGYDVSSTIAVYSATAQNELDKLKEIDYLDYVDQAKDSLKAGIAQMSASYASIQDNVADKLTIYRDNINDVFEDAYSGASNAVRYYKDILTRCPGPTGFLSALKNVMGLNKIENGTDPSFANSVEVDAITASSGPVVCFRRGAKVLEKGGQVLAKVATGVFTTLSLIGKKLTEKVIEFFAESFNPTSISDQHNAGDPYLDGYGYQSNTGVITLPFSNNLSPNEIFTAGDNYSFKFTFGEVTIRFNTPWSVYGNSYQASYTAYFTPFCISKEYYRSVMMSLGFREAYGEEILNNAAIKSLGFIPYWDVGNENPMSDNPDENHMTVNTFYNIDETLPATKAMWKYVPVEKQKEINNFVGFVSSIQLLQVIGYLCQKLLLTDDNIIMSRDNPVKYPNFYYPHAYSKLSPAMAGISQVDNTTSSLDNSEFLTICCGYRPKAYYINKGEGVPHESIRFSRVPIFELHATTIQVEHPELIDGMQTIYGATEFSYRELDVGDLALGFMQSIVYSLSFSTTMGISDYFIPYVHGTYERKAGRYAVKTDMEEALAAAAIVAIAATAVVGFTAKFIWKRVSSWMAKRRYIKQFKTVNEFEKKLSDGALSSEITRKEFKKYQKAKRKLQYGTVLNAGFVSGSSNAAQSAASVWSNIEDTSSISVRESINVGETTHDVVQNIQQGIFVKR